MMKGVMGDLSRLSGIREELDREVLEGVEVRVRDEIDEGVYEEDEDEGLVAEGLVDLRGRPKKDAALKAGGRVIDMGLEDRVVKPTDGPIRRGSLKGIAQLRKEGRKELAEKVERYIVSLGLASRDARVDRECKALSKKLGVNVKPKEYIFLSRIRKSIAEGTKVDFREIALSSGYMLADSANPEVAILAKIDPKITSELLGFNRNDVEREMIKVMKQDGDLAAKMRALELAGKMIGMLGDEKGVSINFNTGIKLGD